MAKLDAEMMKKQHFWLLFIPVLIGLFLAWIGLVFGVAEATVDKDKQNKAARAEIDRAKAQPKKTLELYEERKGKLFDLRTERWKEMWEIQKGVYEWPKSLGDEQVEKVKALKFGNEITNDSFLNAFRDHYVKEYSSLVASAAPLQFSGSWNTVLRHVPVWKRTPQSEDVWLAMEDFWVEKEFIRALAEINNDAGRFEPKADEKTGIRERTFSNRIWEVQLKLVDKPGGSVVEGTIKNRTDRLQPYNANNELVLNIWLNEDANTRPFRYVIEGTSLHGGKSEPVKFVEKKHTVLEGTPRGIYRVEQVFDTRTAPIKRLEQLVLGQLSDRNSLAELQMAAFSTKAVADEAAAAGMGTPMDMGVGGPPAAGVGPGGVGMGPPGGPSGPGGDAASAEVPTTFNGLVRRRYINRTDQVRAMPVGLRFILDQAYVQDALTALSNSKLRFQTVQTSLMRFRNSLTYATASSSTGDTGTGTGAGTGGGVGGPVPPPPPPMGPPGVGGPRGAGDSIPSGPGFPSGFPSGYPGGGGSSTPRSSNEDQVASNLIQLDVYGITSLYEKFEGSTAKKDETPATVGKVDPKVPVTPIAPPPSKQ
ncbi:MAG: hypothetical protein EXS09_08465 [Gemmataceae bacterium]|nr:hypothetical protein [Gemmataceae bacterium]